MRAGRNILFSAPALAAAWLIVTTIAAADTPPAAPHAAPGLAIDNFPPNHRLKPPVSTPAFQTLGDFRSRPPAAPKHDFCCTAAP